MLKLRVILVAFAITFIGSVSANHKSDHSIKERLAPTGKVYREGDDVPVSKPAEVASTGNRDGETVYTASCAMCHSGGIAGAPKTGDAGAWNDRIAKGKEELYKSAIDGFTGDAGMMPPKGGCANCSDEEVKAAVDYLIEQVK